MSEDNIDDDLHLSDDDEEQITAQQVILYAFTCCNYYDGVYWHEKLLHVSALICRCWRFCKTLG